MGANHPFDESQSFHLEQLGWRGLLIEPLPEYCELLRKHRASTVIQCACSNPENHLKKLPIIIAGVHSTLENNLVALGHKGADVIEVETRTLDSVLDENAVVPNFDLLSIDVEGHEIDLFKGFDLEKWRPKLVLIEDHVANHSKHKLMITSGYKLLCRTGLNSWYVPAYEEYRLSFSAKFEFFRKYWLALFIRKIKYKAS